MSSLCIAIFSVGEESTPCVERSGEAAGTGKRPHREEAGKANAPVYASAGPCSGPGEGSAREALTRWGLQEIHFLGVDRPVGVILSLGHSQAKIHGEIAVSLFELTSKKSF